jgi:hypothetical protein
MNDPIVIGIWLLVLGILGAASLIIAKKPEAKPLIDKLAPIQGWLGAISALWGAWLLVTIVLHIGTVFHSLVYGITSLAIAIVVFGLGLLLGVGVLKTFIKNQQAVVKMDRTITLIAPYQGIAGLTAIGLAIWGFVLYFVPSIAAV